MPAKRKKQVAHGRPHGSRLNLVINQELKKWAQDYARLMHTSVTQLLTDFLVRLRESEKSIDVEQI